MRNEWNLITNYQQATALKMLLLQEFCTEVKITT